MKEQSNSSLDGHLSYRQALWCIPAVLLIHNAEEALTLPQWVEANLPLIRERIFLFRYIDFSETQIYVSLFLVSLIPFVITGVCLPRPLEKRRVFALLVLQGIILLNAFMPHLSGIIFLGKYNPGTVTAVAVNIPFSVYLFQRSVREGMFTSREAITIFRVAAIFYMPIILLNHILAAFIAGIL